MSSQLSSPRWSVPDALWRSAACLAHSMGFNKDPTITTLAGRQKQPEAGSPWPQSGDTPVLKCAGAYS